MFNILRKIIYFSGKLFSLFVHFKIIYFLTVLYRMFITGLYSRYFKVFGKGSLVSSNITLRLPEYIEIGINTSIGRRSVLTCYIVNKNPQVVIGDNVSIGDDLHLSCSNKITIFDNVLIGKKVSILDNSHGNTENIEFSTPMAQRKIFSKGEIVIHKNVWIGDKVSIMPNVEIGENTIIGANSVVTKDIPSNVIAAGIPAKVLKILK